MEYAYLTDLITALEYGTKLHISVLFLNHYGNEKTQRPMSQKVHQCPVCDKAKSTPEGYADCFRCRNAVLKLATRRKKPFGGYCIKGVYEYCQPVVRNDQVVAVIFVGNILSGDKESRRRLRKNVGASLLKTMQTDFTPTDCARIADILAGYILILLDLYGDTTQLPSDVLLENIKNYIDENILYDFSMAEMASIFNYNEKYLGRLFKSKTGQTVDEYRNIRKISIAKGLLKKSQLSIADVASQSGFNNVTYFNRIFKRVTGRTPQEYRTQKRNIQ